MKLADLKGKTVGVCVSGGLDSKTICCVLKDAGVKVKAFSANVGQPDEKDINDIKKKMAPTGVETTIVDVTKEMADICFETVKCQAMYDGGYWNSTGIARAVTVQKLLPAMKKAGCVVLVHGATGRGNDQMRFERYTNVLDPKFGVYAPWRDEDLLKQFPGRTQMVEFLAERGIQAFVGTKKKYSTDANLAGLSHEAEDLESMETSMRIVKPTMGVWPEKAPGKLEKITLKFEKGRCVAVNGKKLTPYEVMLAERHRHEARARESHHRHQEPGRVRGTGHGGAVGGAQVHLRRRDGSPVHLALPAALEAGGGPDLRRQVVRSGHAGGAGGHSGVGGQGYGGSDLGALQGQYLFRASHGAQGHDLQRGRQLHGGVGRTQSA